MNSQMFQVHFKMASSAASASHSQRNIDSFQQVHKPGYAMIIININPKGDNGKFEFSFREGANEDSANLQLVFIEKLGFKWINADCHEDVTTEQWDHRKVRQPTTLPEGNCCCLRCRIRNTDHSESKYFVLAISSHGREITETEIIFSDGNSILLTDIFEALNDVPTLKGKPRIIILQVCRAIFKDQKKVLAMQDKGVTVRVAGSTSVQICKQEQSRCSRTDEDAPKTGRFKVSSAEDNTLQQLALSKMPENYLLIYPVVSGQTAKRNPDDGSWLLHGMKKVYLEKYDSIAWPMNFLKFIIEVSGYVARERESVKYKEKSTPSNTSQEDQNQRSTHNRHGQCTEGKNEQNQQSSGTQNEQSTGVQNQKSTDNRPAQCTEGENEQTQQSTGAQTEQITDNRPTQCTEGQNQQSTDDLSVSVAQHGTFNNKKRERKLKKEWERDDAKSGFKNAVCFHHRLISPIIFFPEENIPEIPQVF